MAQNNPLGGAGGVVASNPTLLIILVVVALIAIVVLGIMGVLVALFIGSFFPVILLVAAAVCALGKVPGLRAPYSLVVALILGIVAYTMLFVRF